MVCQPLRLALLIGAITAVAVSPLRADHRASRGGCCDPCASGTSRFAFRNVGGGGGGGEWVRETYQVKRTAYKVECRTETYDTFRTECVPVVKERTVAVTKKVPVYTEQVRKVCHNVTTYEDRIVNKTSYKYVQETCMKKQLVRLGHWENREVQPIFGGGGFGGGLFGGHGHGCRDACADPCANSCNNSNACNNACPRTRKVWVHCPEYRECPVTVCKKVCVTEAVKCKVAVCRQEVREEKVKVCTYQCVTENRVEKCTVYENRKVPCKATRTVRVCVPYEETVTCCKMVRRECAPACTPAPTNCGPTNACASTNNCCDRGSLFGGLRDRLCNRGCNDTCNTSCNTSSRCCDRGCR